MDSVCMGGHKLTNLNTGDEKAFDNIAPGIHLLRCYTNSNLEIKAEVKLVGNSPDLSLVIDTNGKIIKR